MMRKNKWKVFSTSRRLNWLSNAQSHRFRLQKRSILQNEFRTFSAILNARSSNAQDVPAFAVLLAHQLGRCRGIGEGELGGIPLQFLTAETNGDVPEQHRFR